MNFLSNGREGVKTPSLILYEVFYMLRTMVFIDYQNFNINLQTHYNNKAGKGFRSINYQRLAKEINGKLPFQSQVLKTYLFAYKPCEQLMKLERYKKYYNWLENMRKTPYFEVIEGRQEVRSKDGVQFDINDTHTYTTEEKETDINLATHMLAKGFQNAYDIAILVSGDTDYIKVVETLHNIGKTVVIAHFQHQNINKYEGIIDAHIVLYDSILNKSSNEKKNNVKDKKEEHDSIEETNECEIDSDVSEEDIDSSTDDINQGAVK